MSTISIPQRCYLDTSYVLSLLAYIRTPQDSIAQKCKSFYDKCVQNGTLLETSFLTYEECVFALIYKKRILKSCDDFCDINRFSKCNLKQFIRRYPAEYDAIYKRWIGILPAFHREFTNLRIKVRFPHYVNPSLNMSERIISCALEIIKSCNKVEPKDAFHISIALCLGIDTIVTKDGGFKTVPSITVIDPVTDNF